MTQRPELISWIFLTDAEWTPVVRMAEGVADFAVDELTIAGLRKMAIAAIVAEIGHGGSPLSLALGTGCRCCLESRLRRSTHDS